MDVVGGVCGCHTCRCKAPEACRPAGLAAKLVSECVSKFARKAAFPQPILEGARLVKGEGRLFLFFSAGFGRAEVRRRGQGSGGARPRSRGRAVWSAPFGASWSWRRRVLARLLVACSGGWGRGSRQCGVPGGVQARGVAACHLFAAAGRRGPPQLVAAPLCRPRYARGRPF